ncbi:hypothetical protein NDU88_003881 [Pleurodeles waltl]|uniref:Uncharacterized protein n=1 Tax=Pleurodeles waltl TaxID=8319 RepID=A0AAV7PF43_PLEWA|nr:hypothetical protein NDU88_003881 [Pleurodeles waltl]
MPREPSGAQILLAKEASSGAVQAKIDAVSLEVRLLKVGLHMAVKISLAMEYLPEHSVSALLEIMIAFERVSGLRVNNKKSSASRWRVWLEWTPQSCPRLGLAGSANIFTT